MAKSTNKVDTMSKISRIVPCDAVTLSKLKELIARRTTPSGMAQRAKIILACIEGETVQSIVSRLHTSSATVMRWKGRFLEKGLQGLEDSWSHKTRQSVKMESQQTGEVS